MPSKYNNTATSGNRNLVIGVVVAVILAMFIAVGWAIQSNRDTSGDAANSPGGTTDVDPGEVQMQLADEYGLGVGNPDAPVKIEIYEDFQCPYCRDLEMATQGDLLEAAADGDAYVVYRPMAFLNDYSDAALNAFGVVLDVAGGQTAYEFHNALFENQPSEGGDSPDSEWLIDLAKEAGATKPAVAEGIENGDFEQWAVNASDAASKRGVNSTPTVFANGEQVSGQTIDEVAENINEAIDEG